ncbi:ABC transporter ATP-binding protein/permease [Burkholderia ubonensis]|uniref:ABC transporter ATP-binding protein/permease n=1 Tax=Burkholderia ubonensis TaxID=101571 RepID=UPI0009B3EB76|nr:ATP-binding cassette domain-containing protein [Burkholderia ubonensis]
MLPAEIIRDPRDYSINGRFFRRMIALARPYWTRPGAWISWLVFAAIMLAALAETALGAKLSFLTRHMSDALVARHAVSYWHLFTLVTLIGLVIHGGLVSQLFGFIHGWMTLHWRAWLTRDLMRRYLGGRTYYRIEQDGDVDNVDQRIQQEVGPFCNMVMLLPTILLNSISNLGVQGWILHAIAPTLFYGVLVYGAVTAIVTWWMYRPYIRLNFDSTVAEADLRFGILHVRTHAETIALYRGEMAEAASVDNRLVKAVRIALATLRYRLVMNATQSGLGLVWTLLPVVVLVPLYFSGQISFGVITQGTASAGLLLAGIRRLTEFMPIFAMAAPHVVRLSQLTEKSAVVNAQQRDDASAIVSQSGPAIEFGQITLRTPGRERTLLRDLNLSVGRGEHLLVIGQTGVGKSSLLRAAAGLWREGSGTITMPAANQVLFLPQRPYMLLGSLREQILYPATESTLSDAQLQALLEQVNLPELAERHGGFDTVADWSRILSLGEQQRVGFARALAARARYVFLDEATSAVDLVTEKKLYEALAASGATFVSVGHRTSLLAYHRNVLELFPGGESRLLDADEAREESARLKNENVL